MYGGHACVPHSLLIIQKLAGSGSKLLCRSHATYTVRSVLPPDVAVAPSHILLRLCASRSTGQGTACQNVASARQRNTTACMLCDAELRAKPAKSCQSSNFLALFLDCRPSSFVPVAYQLVVWVLREGGRAATTHRQNFAAIELHQSDGWQLALGWQTMLLNLYHAT